MFVASVAHRGAKPSQRALPGLFQLPLRAREVIDLCMQGQTQAMMTTLAPRLQAPSPIVVAFLTEGQGILEAETASVQHTAKAQASQRIVERILDSLHTLLCHRDIKNSFGWILVIEEYLAPLGLYAVGLD